MANRPDHILLDGKYVYELGSPHSRDQIAAAVAAQGSVAQAALSLGVPEEIVRAAIEPDRSVVGAGADRASTTTAQVIKDYLGLLAGVSVLVYVLGGAVLFARLEVKDLPGDAVFGQLPRDFLMTVGVSQVLAPAVVLMTVYAVWRLSRPGPNGVAKRRVIILGLIWWVGLLGVAVWISHAE